jgi:hypothetical protein
MVPADKYFVSCFVLQPVAGIIHGDPELVCQFQSHLISCACYVLCTQIVVCAWCHTRSSKSTNRGQRCPGTNKFRFLSVGTPLGSVIICESGGKSGADRQHCRCRSLCLASFDEFNTYKVLSAYITSFKISLLYFQIAQAYHSHLEPDLPKQAPSRPSPSRLSFALSLDDPF